MAQILRAERQVEYHLLVGHDLSHVNAGVDMFTIASCHAQEAGAELIVKSKQVV